MLRSQPARISEVTLYSIVSSRVVAIIIAVLSRYIILRPFLDFLVYLRLIYSLVESIFVYLVLLLVIRALVRILLF